MNDTPSGEAKSPEMVKAEELVDVMGQKVAAFTARLRGQMAKGVALAREEAEDIVAEARGMSHGPRI